MKKAGIALKNKEDIVNQEKACDLIVPVCELHAGCSKLESLEYYLIVDDNLISYMYSMWQNHCKIIWSKSVEFEILSRTSCIC